MGEGKYFNTTSHNFIWHERSVLRDLWQKRKGINLLGLAAVTIIIAIIIQNRTQSQYYQAFYTLYPNFITALNLGVNITEIYTSLIFILNDLSSKENSTSVAIILFLISSAILLITGIYYVYKKQ